MKEVMLSFTMGKLTLSHFKLLIFSKKLSSFSKEDIEVMLYTNKIPSASSIGFSD